MQDVPPDVRRKVARIVGTKCTLAARVDSFHEASDGHMGAEYKEEIEKKIDKVYQKLGFQSRRLPAPKAQNIGRFVNKLFSNVPRVIKNYMLSLTRAIIYLQGV